MSELTLTKPKKFDDVEKWIVYIVKDDLLTGVAGVGDTPEDATKKAREKIDQGKGTLE